MTERHHTSLQSKHKERGSDNSGIRAGIRMMDFLLDQMDEEPEKKRAEMSATLQLSRNPSPLDAEEKARQQQTMQMSCGILGGSYEFQQTQVTES